MKKSRNLGDTEEKVMSICPVVGHCIMPKEIFHASMWKKETTFLDDEIYEVCVSPFARKQNAVQIHLAVLQESRVLRFCDLNQQMKARGAEAYFAELQKRIGEIINEHFQWEEEGDREIVISYGAMEAWRADSDICTTNLRLVVMVKDMLPVDKEEEAAIRKKLKGELLNWMEEARRDVQADRGEAYRKDYRAILDANLLPHEKENTDIYNTMAIISIVFLLISFFLLDWFFFQVIALVVAGYTGFRAFQKQRYVCAGICAIVAITALVLCFVSYKELQETMKGAQITLQKK